VGDDADDLVARQADDRRDHHFGCARAGQRHPVADARSMGKHQDTV